MYRDNMFCFAWMDKKDVRILSTVSTSAMSTENKPLAIHLYNAVIPGVDMADQMRHGRQVSNADLIIDCPKAHAALV
jgi:hypothetical protein